MRYGIIDIGTNTIRGVVYEQNGEKLEDKLVRSHILQETVNGKLSGNGINRLIVIINKLVQIFRNDGCGRIACFATSAVRELENKAEVGSVVEETTGIKMDILSGAEEAQYDFEALRAAVPERNAAGLDLGGGSCQIIQFEQNRLISARSYNIGSSRMKEKFIENCFPTPEERKKIDFYIRNMLIGEKNLFGVRYLYAMGGSAKAALRIFSAITNNSFADKFLSVEKMNTLCNFCDRDPERMYDIYYHVAKSHADTVITGVSIMNTLCDIFGAEGIYVAKCGIRDGYFKKLSEADKP